MLRCINQTSLNVFQLGPSLGQEAFDTATISYFYTVIPEVQIFSFNDSVLFCIFEPQCYCAGSIPITSGTLLHRLTDWLITSLHHCLLEWFIINLASSCRGCLKCQASPVTKTERRHTFTSLQCMDHLHTAPPVTATDKETLTVNYRHGDTVTNHLRLVQLLRRLEEENQPQHRREACKWRSVTTAPTHIHCVITYRSTTLLMSYY